MISSPLSWALRMKRLDVVRLLLERGALLEHVSALGWTAVFYCWPMLEANQVSMLPFLTLMAAESVLEVEYVDKYGWSVLHRAAAYGVGEDIKKLVALGASLTTSALPLQWNAMFHAVFYGNFDTFLTLLTLYDATIIYATDARGWTLLHIAASAGHDEIVRHLLSLGAAPYSLSVPFTSHMPESLFKKRCTPEDVAIAQSQERREQYLKALHDLEKDGQTPRLTQEADDTDIFWDAHEVVETSVSEALEIKRLKHEKKFAEVP